MNRDPHLVPFEAANEDDVIANDDDEVLGASQSRARPKTLSIREMTREKARRRRAGGNVIDLPIVEDVERPRTRADCASGPRPCPFVSCKHHLYIDVTESGSIKLNFPHLEPDQLRESCALDVADNGGLTYEAVSELTNVVRERVRQIETAALARIRETQVDDLDSFVGWEPSDRRAGEALSHAGAAASDEPEPDLPTECGIPANAFDDKIARYR